MAWYRVTAMNEGRIMFIGRKRVVPKPFRENHGMIDCLAL